MVNNLLNRHQESVFTDNEKLFLPRLIDPNFKISITENDISGASGVAWGSCPPCSGLDPQAAPKQDLRTIMPQE